MEEHETRRRSERRLTAVCEVVEEEGEKIEKWVEEDKMGQIVLWKLWILQRFSGKTRYGLTISGTLKQEGSILIPPQ